MTYSFVLSLHVTGILCSTILLVVSEVLLVIGRNGRLKMLGLALSSRRIGDRLLSAALVAGALLLFMGGWSPLTGWMLLSLVLVGVLKLVAAHYVRPWELSMEMAMVKDARALPLSVLLAGRRAIFFRLSLVALILIIAGLMICKPQF